MTESQDSTIELLRQLTGILRKLKGEQIDQLIQGTAELIFLPPGASVFFPGPDASEVRARLGTVPNRQEGARYIDSLKLKKSELVSLARQLDVAVGSKDTIPVIKRRIVGATVGARQDAEAIRGGSWRD